MPQINLGVVFGEKTRLPILYRYLSGNIPDSKTIPWLLSLLNNFSKAAIKAVMDWGFYNEANVYALIENEIGFVMGAKKNLTYIKAALEAVRPEINHVEHYSPIYKMTGKRIQTDYFHPRSGKGRYPVQVYIYYKRD